MPYLKPSDKTKFNGFDFDLIASHLDCAGDINFFITKLLHAYINKKGLRYQNLNDVEGALSCCSKEFYRRVTGPYEDLKIKENGDVMDIKLPEEGKY